MSWWNPFWGARTASTQLSGPEENTTLPTPTSFVEIKPPLQPLDGSHHEVWIQTVQCAGCGWLPGLEWYLGAVRRKHFVTSSDPCPGCGHRKLLVCVGRPWTDPHRLKFWWELK